MNEEKLRYINKIIIQKKENEKIKILQNTKKFCIRLMR